MTKNQRECFAICRDAGLHPVGVEFRGKHFAVVCVEGRIFCACTPSDCRSHLNLRSCVRRLAHACQPV